MVWTEPNRFDWLKIRSNISFFFGEKCSEILGAIKSGNSLKFNYNNSVQQNSSLKSVVYLEAGNFHPNIEMHVPYCIYNSPINPLKPNDL
jgi:hypothetical protein